MIIAWIEVADQRIPVEAESEDVVRRGYRRYLEGLVPEMMERMQGEHDAQMAQEHE